MAFDGDKYKGVCEYELLLFFISFFFNSLPFLPFVCKKLSKAVKIFAVGKLHTCSVPSGYTGDIPKIGIAAVETNYP